MDISLEMDWASAPLLRLPELLLEIGIGGVPISRDPYRIGTGASILNVSQAQVDETHLRQGRGVVPIDIGPEPDRRRTPGGLCVGFVPLCMQQVAAGQFAAA